MATPDILETIDSVPHDNFTTLFVNKLVAILEHSQDEILEVLKTKPVDKLKELRTLVFSEFTTVLPQYAAREMYARRNIERLAEDIFVFSFSAVNALSHKKLSKCLKQQIDLDATHVSDAEPELQDIHDQQSLIELCIKLQDKIRSLEETSKKQNDRILVLEDQVTNILISPLSAPRDQSHPKDGSKDQAEGGVAGQPQTAGQAIQTDLATPPQLDDDPPFPPPPYHTATTDDLAERASDATQRQNTVNPEPQGAPSQQTTTNQLVNPSDTDFRHTSRQRKNIQKGQIGLRSAVPHTDIRGTSSNTYCISAAGQSSTNTFLVYVGNLDVGTTDQDLRRHISTQGITDVSDVISLKGKYSSKQASFCVSFNNASDMKKMFQADIWPIGVIIRPFRPSNRQRGHNRSHHGPSQYNRTSGHYSRNNRRTTDKNRRYRTGSDRQQWENRFDVFQDDYRLHHDRNDWDQDQQDSQYDHFSYRYNDWN
jgi:hypothetical protein